MRFNKLVDETISGAVDLLKKHKSIYEIRLFGSQTKKQSHLSDIDLAIFCYNKCEYNKIVEEIATISNENKMLIHPVIFDEDINEICKNRYTMENIICGSKILYSNK